MSPRRTVSYEVDVDDLARRGRIGGYTTAARHDSRELTLPARKALHKKFLIEVDPENVLPEPERNRRAEAARKAHYTRLARLSALSRTASAKSRPEGNGHED